MMDLIRYELKKRKSAIVFLVLEILIFGMAYIIRTKSPYIIIKFARMVNDSDWFRTFLGFDEKIENITCQNVMMAVLTVFIIIMLAWCFVSSASSVITDRRFGVLDFFGSQKISQTVILLKKLCISMIICVSEMLVLWFMIWRFSLYKVADVEFFYKVISEDVASVMKECIGAAFLFVSLGFLYGCISKNYRQGKTVFTLLAVLCTASLVPNFLRALTALIENGNVEIVGAKTVYKFAVYMRRFNPIYWCNPGAVLNTGKVMAWWSFGIGVAASVMGIVLYNRKKNI